MVVNFRPAATEWEKGPIVSSRLAALVLAVLLVGLASPARSDDFAEGNAWQWGTFASDGAATLVEDEVGRVVAGQASIRFTTESGFDTGVIYPAARDAHWDLSAMTLLEFWEYAVNDNPNGFQGPQPVVVLETPTGKIRYEPREIEMFDRAWHLYRIPLAGDEFWTRTEIGNPDITDVLSLEIHQDTWDDGFTIYYDGVHFVQMNPGGLPPYGPPPPAGVDPDQVEVRALLLVYDPVMENKGGLRRHQAYGWNDPLQLVEQIVADLATSSHDRAAYRVVETMIVDDYPVMLDGFRYDDASYDQALATGEWHDVGFDYARMIADANLAHRIESGEIDEIWIYDAPGGGMWESTMAGDGGYWCNSPPVEGVPSERVFVVMGWNTERGVAEALHSWGHRAESIMVHSYGPWEPNRETTWNAFTLQDRQVPGQGSIGNVHFPVNGEADYDYSNPRYVSSDADDWYDYPAMTGRRRMINDREWSPEHVDPHREYLNWWYDHMPHATSKGADHFLANWWRYLLDPEQFKGWDGRLYYASGFGDVAITTPAAGEAVAGVVTVKARIAMDGATGRADLYVDGQYVATDKLAPWTFHWDARGLSGEHRIEVRAYELQAGTESSSPPVTVSVGPVAPVPGEVSPPGSHDPLSWTDNRTLVWEPAEASGAERFNLYRGAVKWLDDGVGGSCRLADLEAPGAVDAETPWPGEAWFYLVTGESSGGEGIRGRDSAGQVRTSSPSCY